MKKSILLMTYALCLFTRNTVAQDQQITSYFKSVGGQLNGNILLAQNGKVIVSRASGYADFGTKKLNNVASRFNVCSISKVFTSTAILQLRDKGKLSLDDQLIKYFPDFPFPDITLRHLLTHTSGLPDFALYDMITQKNPDTVITNKDILPALKNWKNGLFFKPGDEFRYCSVGYSLLSIVVEKVSGLSFSVYLERYIFKPAGMTDTYLSIYPARSWHNDPRCVKMHIQSHPYYDTTYSYADSASIFDYVKFNNYNCGGVVGGQNVISTTSDLLQFDRAWFAGKLLKTSTMAEALTPVKLNNGQIYYGQMDTYLGDGKMGYGLGWDIWEMPGYGKSVGHDGFLFGEATTYLHNLKSGGTIIAFDNTAGSEFGRIVTSSLYLLNGNQPMEIRNHHSMAFVYGNSLVKDGPDAAASALNAIKSDTAQYYMNEWEFNQLGGNMINLSTFKGHDILAVEVFKLNTFLFPGSANVYDSYAYGLRRIGKSKEAIEMYRKSLSIDSNNDDGKQALKELLEGK